MERIQINGGVRELGREVGISAVHASHILRGLRTPSLTVAARIAKHMGVSIDVLYKRLQQVQKHTQAQSQSQAAA